MTEKGRIIQLLADLMTGDVFVEADVIEAVEPLVIGTKAKWLRPLVRRLAASLGEGRRLTRRAVVAALRRDEPFHRAWEKGQIDVDESEAFFSAEPQMAAAQGPPSQWQVPHARTLAELASVLRIHEDDLGWLTSHGKAEHYLYRWQRKRGSGAGRLIELPKPLLKQAQRAVLDKILVALPPHPAAHGFCRGRSVRTYVESHCGQEVVVKMDLEDFFPSTTYGRVVQLFMTAGYPEPVAGCLASLCTNRPPAEVIADRPQATTRSSADRLKIAHLPQGAPSSPPLANLAAFRLDCRLAGLAEKAGGGYTRYADDLLFSGDRNFARGVERFITAVAAICVDCGFHVAHRKTRVMRASLRQRAAGVVINRHPNLSRLEFDRLKATLSNCARYGAASQNRSAVPEFRAHLEGRVAWAASLNPTRAEKLREILKRIDWTS